MSNEITIFEQQWKIANVFANSDLVPVHFKKAENTWIALELAQRMEINPFMLMQNLYIIHGKPGIEGKLVIALINNSGKFSDLEYDISGDGDDYGCVAFASRIKTSNVVRGPRVTIRMAKEQGWYANKGSKWPSMPQLMLTYRAATFFARTNCPEVMFGMQTKDEIQDAVTVGSDNVQIDYVPVQENKKEEYILEKKQEATPMETKAVNDAKIKTDEHAAAAKFPTICGNVECKNYNPSEPSNCTVKQIHGSKDHPFITAECNDIKKMTGKQVLQQIVDDRGLEIVTDALSHFGWKQAGDDTERWEIVKYIRVGE